MNEVRKIVDNLLNLADILVKKGFDWEIHREDGDIFMVAKKRKRDYKGDYFNFYFTIYAVGENLYKNTLVEIIKEINPFKEEVVFTAYVFSIAKTAEELTNELAEEVEAWLRVREFKKRAEEETEKRLRELKEKQNLTC